MMKDQTLLAYGAVVSLIIFILLGIITAFVDPRRAEATRPFLTHLWRIAVALFLAAIYRAITSGELTVMIQNGGNG